MPIGLTLAENLFSFMGLNILLDSRLHVEPPPFIVLGLCGRMPHSVATPETEL